MVRSKQKFAATEMAQEAHDEGYEQRFKYQNLMFERRVVRGNTHGSYVLSKEDEYLYKLNNQSPARLPGRKPAARAAAEAHQPSDLDKSGSWAEKRSKKVNVACFTEKQLIYETDLPPCHDATTQTEFVIPKEIPDLTYLKGEKKPDKETQIYPDEPPFDFNYEAEPIVQVLMTRILEESRVEVLEEEELRAMKLRQQHLLEHKAEVKRKLEQLEEKERALVKANEAKKAEEHQSRKKMITTHQHLVSRVFAKNFLRDVQSHAFEILESTGLYADEEEKNVKDELLPWLYTEVVTELKKSHKVTHFLSKTIESVSKQTSQHHAEIVRAENERRRLAKEEADRLAFEKAERRRLKLEMKLRRRENRRLFALEKLFTEVYAATADIEKDLINVADIDGTDNNGMKSIGLRGGLIGEVYFQLRRMKTLPQFSAIGVDWPQFPALMSAFWHSMVGEGWTVMIGQDPAFDRNIIPVMEGINLDRLDSEFIKAMSGTDTSGILTYLKAHARNNFLDARFPGLIDRRERLLSQLKYEPPADDQAGGDKDDNADNDILEQDLNQAPIPAPEDDPEATPEQIDLLKYLDLVFNQIFDESGGIDNIRFVRIVPKVPEEKKDLDSGEPLPPTPKVTAVFIPVPPPAEDLGAGDATPTPAKPTDTKPADPKVSDSDQKPDGDGDDQDGEKKPVEPEVLPFVPEETDFLGDFDPQVSLIDYGKKDLDVASFHVPLAKAVATKLFAAAASLLAVEGDLSDLVNDAVLAAVHDVQDFSQETGRDVLYINSY